MDEAAMKKVVPNGVVVKALREQLERLSTQKEMANEIGVSVRKLRMIENENAPIAVSTADRLAKVLQVHRERIVMTASASVALLEVDAPAISAAWTEDEDRLIPRHDYDIASATSDEGHLYSEAARSHDLACVIETKLDEETGAYAEELFDILGGLTWSQRNILEDIPPVTEIALRRRIRQLIVLLKGNDVWIYQTSVLRRLPERYTIAPEGEPCTYQNRYVVALGPPGEYGEITIRVPIDPGQPFVLPAWNRFKKTLTAETDVETGASWHHGIQA
jgi:DNA-binding XRE family transcriptional regulator